MIATFLLVAVPFQVSQYTLSISAKPQNRW
jgi:hypothetical protein